MELLRKKLGGDFEEVEEKNKHGHEKKIDKDNSELQAFAKSIKIDDLVYVRKLGQGQFGLVYLVIRNNTESGVQERYALKCVNKG